MVTGAPLHPDAIGLRLIRYDRNDQPIPCEYVIFDAGRPAVDTTLRRAALHGRVEIDGEIGNYQADVLIDENGTWEQVIALDANSYRALKTKWMRCKVDRAALA